MVGGTKFYSRKEIRDVIAYLNLIANLSDNISFERIINEPKRGIGPGTVDKIRDFAQMQESSLLDASANIMLSGIKGKAAQAIWDFANLILDLRERLDQLTITELVEEVLDKTGYMTALTNQEIWKVRPASRISKSSYLLPRIFDENGETVEDESGVETLSRFLNDLALIADTDDGAKKLQKSP